MECRSTRRVFLLMVNDWDSASRRSLHSLGSDGTVVTCTIGGVTMELVSNEPGLLDLLAAAPRRGGRMERRTVAKCARQHTCGVVGSGKCVQFDPVLVHRAKMEEKDFVDKMGL